MRAGASSMLWKVWRLGLTLQLVAVASLAHAAAPARLEPLPWSPAFAGAGSIHNLAVAPDGGHLYVVSLSAGVITALQVGPAGDLLLAGVYPTTPSAAIPGGIAFSPGGGQLYVAGYQQLSAHQIDGEGRLSGPTSFPAVAPWSNPLNGLVYASLAGGDFLFVNDNAVPSSVSAWRVEADGALAYVASTPSGGIGSGESAASLVAAPRLATGGGRLFTLDAPGRNGVGNSTVTVFDIGPDGSLTPAPGSPWDMGSRAGALVVDPTGQHLYVGGGGTSASVMKFEVTAAGALALQAVGSAEGMVGKPNGLALDPSGRFVAFTATLGGGLTVLDAATLAHLEGGRVAGPNLTGLTFDPAGRLYVADARGWIFGFEIVTAQPPVVTCVGQAAAPVRLEADPWSCTFTVEAGAGLAGSCADGGGGLASCTLDGAAALVLTPGSRSIEVRAAALDGSTSACTSWIEVVDVTPPQLAVAPAPAVLWPPDHALVSVALGAVARDGCDGVVAPVCSVASSEPDEVAGAGSTSPDVRWWDGGLWLRAERSGTGPGRTYAITCEASDSAGNTGRARGAVTVPLQAPRSP